MVERAGRGVFSGEIQDSSAYTDNCAVLHELWEARLLQGP